MSGFYSFSDSSDENTVEELLNQAMDHCVLDQLAKINCSSFSSYSVLPANLETRFSRLKSFPVTNTKCRGDFDSQKSCSQEGKRNEKTKPVTGKEFKQNFEPGPDSFVSKSTENDRKGIKSGRSEVSGKGIESGRSEVSGKGIKSGKVQVSGKGSGSDSSNSSSGEEYFSPLEKNLRGRKGGKNSKEGKSVKARTKNDWSDYDFSPSPPKKSGCFWCSPKKGSGKNRAIGKDDVVFSKKEQTLINKAVREEEKISREAEKIVKWVKQESARMNISDFEDKLSDTENFDTKYI